MMARTLTAFAPALALAVAVSAVPARAMEACGEQAARYENGKGFAFVVIRAGEARVVNPLRPLTPEVTQVLEVVIGAKRATAYGPDFTSLRRGGTPSVVQAMLGAPITWEPKLPALPDTLNIVSEEGTPLAELGFKLCVAPPAIAPEAAPQAKKGAPRKGGSKAAEGGAKTGGTKAAAKPAKTPQGFSIPQGAVAE